MLRTATVTWIYYNNFGTALQAYALQKAIQSLGIENDILYDEEIIKSIIEKKRAFEEGREISLIEKIKFIVRNSLNRLIKKKDNEGPIAFDSESVDSIYREFKEKWLQINYDILPLEALNNIYDKFICGSDQIWHPILEFEPYYYLGFATKGKIAYAPSIGAQTVNEDYKHRVYPYLDQFDFLSVREKSGEKIIASFVKKIVQTVVDPTLLLNSKDWSVFISQDSPEKEKYLLCYFLTANQWYVDWAIDYAKKNNLRLKVLSHPQQYKFHPADAYVNAGPIEFLNYIYHSEYFLTDSFHGTLFSLQFHKKFLTFKRFVDGEANDQNSRLISIYDLLGIPKEYLIDRDSIKDIKSIPSVDFASIDENIGKQRDLSIQYLKKALGL